MKKIIQMIVTAGITTFLLTGCATNLNKPTSAPRPASVRLGTFSNVEMLPAPVGQQFAKSGANQKAAKKINEILNTQMQYVFPNLNSADKKDGKTLLIEPRIKEIKFIGGAARFWVGAMAGSSAVLMDVTYKDKDSGDVIAAAEFYDQASAMAGSYNMGATDNMMLNNIVNQIITYTTANK